MRSLRQPALTGLPTSAYPVTIMAAEEKASNMSSIPSIAALEVNDRQCFVCRLNPVHEDAHHIFWCEQCMSEMSASSLGMDDWIAIKHNQVAFEIQLRLACTGCYPQDNLTTRQLCECTCHEWDAVQAISGGFNVK